MNSWVMLYMARNSCNFNLGWRIARTPRSFAHLPWAASHAAKTASAFSRNISALFRTRFFENIKQMGQLKHKVIAEHKKNLKCILSYFLWFFISKWIQMMSPVSSFLKRWKPWKYHLLIAKRNSVQQQNSSRREMGQLKHEVIVEHKKDLKCIPSYFLWVLDVVSEFKWCPQYLHF